ncbi:MAG: hypothetical protein EAZ55_05440 [Cytophagales bacterium]|nr:MAG: hypothetical protein EAZ55_05440 [Cytophagales bacterium]
MLFFFFYRCYYSFFFGCVFGCRVFLFFYFFFFFLFSFFFFYFYFGCVFFLFSFFGTAARSEGKYARYCKC